MDEFEFENGLNYNGLNYIEEIKSLTGGQKTYFLSTFGCQMNAHDSERLRGMLEAMGYSSCESEKEADLCLYNTCCVRENAENRMFGHLGMLKHLKKSRPDFRIVLCGCMTQQDKVFELLTQKYPFVDVVLGTFNLHQFPELLYKSLTTHKQVAMIWKEHADMEDELPAVRDFPFKSGVNIMYGCDNFCSYCIVPYVRGRERSRDVSAIIEEVRALASDGVKEIMLLGQNVNSYKSGEVDFPALLRDVAKVSGVRRVRFMTSHPKDLSDELISVVRDVPEVCKTIHLPVQSGSSRILQKMNRKYDKQGYLALVDKIYREIPGISLTTDIIVGFPGETEEDFLETLDVVKKAKFAGVFTFLYSKRTGTPAAQMDEQVEESVAKERFNRLLDMINPILLERKQAQVGKVFSVLVEEVQEGGMLSGRSEDGSVVLFPGDSGLYGEIVDVKITGTKTFHMWGERV